MGKDLDIEKLRGSDNYHTWQFAMMSYLTYQDLDEAFETASSPAASGEIKPRSQQPIRRSQVFSKNQLKQRQSYVCALNLHYMYMSKNVKVHVMSGIRLKRCLKMRILPERLGS